MEQIKIEFNGNSYHIDDRRFKNLVELFDKSIWEQKTIDGTALLNYLQTCVCEGGRYTETLWRIPGEKIHQCMQCGRYYKKIECRTQTWAGDMEVEEIFEPIEIKND